MEKEKKNSKIIEKIASRMKRDKRFEMLVYAGIAAIALILYFSSLSSCDKAPEAAPTYAESTESMLELRLIEMISGMAGVGEVNVMVRCESAQEHENSFSSSDEAVYERVVGVIVSAEGAEHIAVRLAIENAVCTVLGIDEKCVDVFEYDNADNGGQNG